MATFSTRGVAAALRKHCSYPQRDERTTGSSGWWVYDLNGAIIVRYAEGGMRHTPAQVIAICNKLADAIKKVFPQAQTKLLRNGEFINGIMATLPEVEGNA